MYHRQLMLSDTSEELHVLKAADSLSDGSEQHCRLTLQI